MATVLLSTVGNILLPGVGGYIGAAVGSYIDQNYLLPALFPQDPHQGPRLADLKVASAQEGDPSAICLGEDVRIAGTVIYLSDLIEQKNEQSGGGKGGGGGQTVVTYDYFVNMAISFCMNEIENFDEIFADGKTVWRREQQLDIDYHSGGPPTDIIITCEHATAATESSPFTGTISDGSLAAGQSNVHLSGLTRTFEDKEIFTVAGDTTEYVVVSFASDGGGTGTVTFRPLSQQLWTNGSNVTFSGIQATDTFEVIRSPTQLGAPDLSVFKSGNLASVSGFPKSQNNGSFQCILATTNDDGSTKLKLQNDNAQPDDGVSVQLQQDNPAFWSGLADSFTMYFGTQTQLPDAFLESLEGVGTVPSYRGTSYVVVQRLHLNDFGNRVPNIEGLVREKTGRQLKDVISRLVERAGYTTDQYDVTGIAA